MHFDRRKWACDLRSTRRGAATGLAGNTAEHLKVMLDDEGDTELLADAAENLAQAKVPSPTVAAFRMGALTALQKEGGKVRGIVAGDTLRRSVARLRYVDARSESTARAGHN